MLHTAPLQPNENWNEGEIQPVEPGLCVTDTRLSAERPKMIFDKVK